MAEICARCVLPANGRDVWLDAEGVCNICRSYEKASSRADRRPPLGTDLDKIVSRHKGRGPYDSLVMCSGGKDSTLALYYMKKRYGASSLAFTFDQGFETEAALSNVRRAVDTLGVDWVYIKSGFMKRAFRILLESGSRAPICHLCAIGYMRLTLGEAARRGIRLVVGGWTRGQAVERGEGAEEYSEMSKATSDFVRERLRKEPGFRDFPASINECVSRFGRNNKLVSPLWYIDDSPERRKEVLEGELGWKAPASSYPSGTTNCMLNFLNVELSLENYGYTHYHAELAKLVRMAKLGREDALEMLRPRYGRETLERVLERLRGSSGEKAGRDV